jgi:hypothetical protein
MIRRPRLSPLVVALGGLLAAALGPAAAQPSKMPVYPEWRDTARKVADAGVPLAELAPNAPDTYTVKRGDTLWDISTMFLLRPWRWPELWGMNLEQIRNPHLIFPGQVLVLEKVDGRARLRLADGQAPDNTVKLSPRVRSEPLDTGAITAIPLHLIAPFLNEAVVFNTDELALAPRIVAAQESRVLLGRGDTAYVRGDTGERRDFRVFREAVPLVDPQTKEVLGYEARYLGTAEQTRQGDTRTDTDGKPEIVPASFVITGIREEVGIGDRLAPVPPREFKSYVPHAPDKPVAGQIVKIYGDALNAGQNQIVALNRGAVDGMERGHVLALWREGERTVDKTDPKRAAIRLPDERHGLLFVFNVFDRVSYALILQVQQPVKAGDRFTQP